MYHATHGQNKRFVLVVLGRFQKFCRKSLFSFFLNYANFAARRCARGHAFHFSGDTMSTMRHSAYSVRRLTNLQHAHMRPRVYIIQRRRLFKYTRERARASITPPAEFPSFSVSRVIFYRVYVCCCVRRAKIHLPSRKRYRQPYNSNRGGSMK